MTTKTVDRHDMAHAANDLIVSDIIHVNETEVRFLAQHLVEAPLVRADR